MVFPRNHPERADIIEGSIGELSPFHETFGYYAQAVTEETARLPEGWQDRLVVVQNENTRGARGLCLEIHDLLASKIVAGREKDYDFLREAAKHGLADRATLLDRLETVHVDPIIRASARAAVERAFAFSTR